MSVQKINVLVPPLRGVPPGAAWAANAVAWLFGTDPRRASLQHWLAAARVRRLAERALRREARERQELIAMARRYASSQPEFAKDLVAAAMADRRA
jgi:hypothetical protein